MWPTQPPVPAHKAGHGGEAPSRTTRPPGRGRLLALIAVGAVVLVGLGVGSLLLFGAPRTGAVTDRTAVVRTGALEYTVPADWTQGGAPLSSPFGFDFSGVVRAPAYDCAGRSLVRGIAASAVLPSTVSAASITGLTQVLAEALYTPPDGTRPTVAVGSARNVDVGGIQGRLIEATARTSTDDRCLASEGTVLVLAVPAIGPDGRQILALLVVNGDRAGGPIAAPPTPTRATLDAIVASARVAGI